MLNVECFPFENRKILHLSSEEIGTLCGEKSHCRSRADVKFFVPAMSEFKFACAVCGQHITADSEIAGSQLQCPTCFRKIVVPQAPSAADPKFIRSEEHTSALQPPY